MASDRAARNGHADIVRLLGHRPMLRTPVPENSFSFTVTDENKNNQPFSRASALNGLYFREVADLADFRLEMSCDDYEMKYRQFLWLAVRLNYVELVKTLLSEPDSNPGTGFLLVEAAQLNRPEIVSLFLNDARTDVNFSASLPLRQAINNGNIECVRLFLDDERICIPAQFDDVLDKTIIKGNICIAKLLLACPRIRVSLYALSFAAKYGRKELVQFMLETNDLRFDVRQGRFDVFVTAVSYKQVAVVEYLLDYMHDILTHSEKYRILYITFDSGWECHIQSLTAFIVRNPFLCDTPEVKHLKPLYTNVCRCWLQKEYDSLYCVLRHVKKDSLAYIVLSRFVMRHTAFLMETME